MLKRTVVFLFAWLVASTAIAGPWDDIVKTGGAGLGAGGTVTGPLMGDLDLELYGDVGTREVTVDNYVNCTLEDVTTTINGVDCVCTESDTPGAGEWDAVTSNSVSATNLATCIDSCSGVSATATAAVVTITHPLLTTYSVTLAESEPTCTTLASGADGVVDINRLTLSGRLLLPDGSESAPSIAHAGDDDTGIYFTGNTVDITTGGTRRISFQGGNIFLFEQLNAFGEPILDSTQSLCIGGDACDAAGSAGTTTFSTAVLFDVTTRFDSLAEFTQGVRLNDGKVLNFGTSSDARIIYDDFNHDVGSFVFTVPATSNSIVITETVDIFVNNELALQVNPSLYGKSADAGSPLQYWHLTHDKTATLFTTKTGPVTLRGELGTKSTQIQTAANCGTDTIEATVTTSSGDTLVTCLEGTDWNKTDGNNDASATSLAACFNAGAGIGATATTDTVTLTYLDTTLRVVLTTDDVTCATVSNGADSGVAVHGQLLLPDGDATNPSIAWASGGGVYSNSPDQTAISAGGSRRFSVGTGTTINFNNFNNRGFINNDTADLALGTNCDSAGVVMGVCVGGPKLTVDNILQLDGLVGRANDAVTIANGATTFAITTTFATVTGDGGGDEIIATITGGIEGTLLTILCVDALWTIVDDDGEGADTINLESPFVAADNEILVLLYDGTSWRETARSRPSETSLTIHAEMGVTGGAEITIGTATVIYPIETFITGSVNGWTFAASDTGPCANMTTADSGSAVNCNDVGHNLVTGDTVIFSNVTPEPYNGVFAVTRVDDDNFTIVVSFTNNDTGDWVRADRLIANTGSAGTYAVWFGATMTKGAGASQEFKVQGYINENASTKMILEREFSSADAGGHGFVGIITIADDDEVFLTITNNDGTNNMTIDHGNIILLDI